jgi:hypothetical protein
MPLSLPSHLVNHRIESLQPRSNIFVNPKLLSVDAEKLSNHLILEVHRDTGASPHRAVLKIDRIVAMTNHRRIRIDVGRG